MVCFLGGCNSESIVGEKLWSYLSFVLSISWRMVLRYVCAWFFDTWTERWLTDDDLPQFVGHHANRLDGTIRGIGLSLPRASVLAMIILFQSSRVVVNAHSKACAEAPDWPVASGSALLH